MAPKTSEVSKTSEVFLVLAFSLLPRADSPLDTLGNGTAAGSMTDVIASTALTSKLASAESLGVSALSLGTSARSRSVYITPMAYPLVPLRAFQAA